MGYQLVLFDFDYTLADSSRGIVTCFQNVLKRHNFTDIEDETVKRTIGKPLEESFSILSGIEDDDTITSFKKEYVKEADTHMTVNTFLFPDTVHLLQELKKRNIKIGIISTKYRYRIIEFFEKHFSPDNFDIMVGGEDVTKHKPDPEGLLFAMNKLHCKPEEVLYIGDSTIDAETAERANVDFVGVTTGMTTLGELSAFPHVSILPRLGDLLKEGIV